MLPLPYACKMGTDLRQHGFQYSNDSTAFPYREYAETTHVFVLIGPSSLTSDSWTYVCRL